MTSSAAIFQVMLVSCARRLIDRPGDAERGGSDAERLVHVERERVEDRGEAR